MTIRKPSSEDIPRLRQLWTEVFGDEAEYLDLFFAKAYSPDRCLCALEGDALAGALYWLPCDGFAYLYAVATHPDHRGKGICRSLTEKAHEAIAAQGCRGVLLFPQEEGLRKMYRKLGYTVHTHIRQLRCAASAPPEKLEKISAEEYFRLRKALLPPGGVAQEGPFPALSAELRFFRGEGLLLAAWEGEPLHVQEYLGDPGRAGNVLAALGAREGAFLMPGEEIPFAMYCPLKEGPAPAYFAFPLL